MFATLILTALLVATITASPIAEPLPVEWIDENTLVIRESKVDISTTILMSPHKIPYGNTHVADMIKKALGPACEGQQDGICDPTSTALKQPTQVYGGENEFPPTYTMSFDTAGTHFAEFMVTNYVTALANMGAAFETSKTESWRVCEGTDCDNGSPPVQGSGTFYYGPMNFNLERKNTTTSGTIDTFIVTVTIGGGGSEAEIWCKVDDLLSLIAGCFSGALAAVFGTAALGC